MAVILRLILCAYDHMNLTYLQGVQMPHRLYRRNQIGEFIDGRQALPINKKGHGLTNILWYLSSTYLKPIQKVLDGCEVGADALR